MEELGVRGQADEIAPLGTPIGHGRGGRDGRFQRLRVVAVPGPVVASGTDVEHDVQAIGGGRLEQFDLQRLVWCAGRGFPVHPSWAIARAIVADPDSAQRVLEQPLATQRHVAKRVAGGQRQTFQGHDLGVDQQVVLAPCFDFLGGQPEDVARAQDRGSEIVKPTRATGDGVVTADAFVPAHRQQHGQQPPTRDVRGSLVRGCEGQPTARDVVLDLQPGQWQWLLIDDLQG